MTTRRDQNQAVFRKRRSFELQGRVDWVPDNTNIREAFRDRWHDRPTRALPQVDVDIGMGRKKGGQRSRKKFCRHDGNREDADSAPQPRCELI